ncbi:hypothetical protein A3Q56_07472 [Intoshia linei]|uniref:Uncharacterized protein n=1 Tax=Intoshia linei TaxID=1819745 RepID=A0A177AUC1_9BILA|nr:hypothetical protein A3Q56_07472 [Intoshia linei]
MDERVHIFFVDIGRLFDFDATFYEKKFLYLCDEIYQATEVLPEHQVILVSGGSTICMDKKVKTFNAGTCSNPFFLFSKINCKYRDIVFEELCDEYKFLKNEHKLVLSMEVSLDCIKSRTNLAKSCYRLSKKYFDRLTKDIKAQHFQNQGWNTAISNITAVSEAFKKRSQIFISNFEKFLRNAEKNSMILFK